MVVTEENKTRTFICASLAAMLCVVATAADAEPLYLKCEGKEGHVPEPAKHSVTLDDPDPLEHFPGNPRSCSPSWPCYHRPGYRVTVDGYPARQITESRDGDIGYFDIDGIVKGQIDRITGRAEMTFSTTQSRFEGVCRKAEKPL
jgi:hypothetical protein